MTDALMQDAKKLHMAGRIADAAGLYQRILHANPTHFEALYGLGMAHAQAGRLDEAQRLLTEVVRLRPGFAEAWRARGMMLMHMGRSEEALAAFDRAIALRPDFKEALSARANLLVQMNKREEALAAMEASLAADPGNANDWNVRGSLLVSLQRLEEALESYGKAIALKPRYAESHSNRATVLFELNRLDEALAAFDAALAIEPKLAIAWSNRGNTLAKMKRFDDAVQSFDRALAIEPDLAAVRENRELVLFEGGRAERGPPKYIQGLFDSFSRHYDEKMLGTLGYRAHLHLRDMAEQVLPRSAPWRILDLGCGTGLAGTVFRPFAEGGRLDGLDLSPRMLDAAKARGIYDHLFLGDIEAVLAQPGPGYDLMLACDTMIYLGNLSPAFAGIAGRLEQGGFFLFSTEAKAGEGWLQTKVHRYRHSESYLRAEAAEAGLDIVEIAECVLRTEEHEPVQGYVIALKKPG